MELKPYQKNVIVDLVRFLELVNEKKFRRVLLEEINLNLPLQSLPHPSSRDCTLFVC